MHALAAHVEELQNFFVSHELISLPEESSYAQLVAEQLYINELASYCESKAGYPIHVNPEVLKKLSQDNGLEGFEFENLPSSQVLLSSILPSYAVLTLLQDIEAQTRGFGNPLEIIFKNHLDGKQILDAIKSSDIEDSLKERLVARLEPLIAEHEKLIRDRAKEKPKEAFDLISSYTEKALKLLKPPKYRGEDDAAAVLAYTKEKLASKEIDKLVLLGDQKNEAQTFMELIKLLRGQLGPILEKQVQSVPEKKRKKFKKQLQQMAQADAVIDLGELYLKKAGGGEFSENLDFRGASKKAWPLTDSEG